MITLLTPRPNPHRAKELVVARPGDVQRELRLQRAWADLGREPERLYVRGGGMMTWTELLSRAEGDGPALSGSVAETNIIPTGAIFTMPANWWDIGRMIRFTIRGRLTTAASTPGTLRFLIRYGAVGSGVILADTTALALATSLANNTFWWKGEITCRSIGSGTGGTAIAISELVGVTAAAGQVQVPATAPAVTSGFDTTLATSINVSAIFSSATTNALTVHQYALEALN